MSETKGSADPLRGMQKAVGFHEAAAGHEHKRDGNVRHVIGEHIGRVCHADATLLAPSHRHAIIPHPHHTDDFQLGKSRELRRAELGAAKRHDGSDILGWIRQLAHLVGSFERLAEKIRNGRGKENFGEHAVTAWCGHSRPQRHSAKQ
jgi:hypothetical protein